MLRLQKLRLKKINRFGSSFKKVKSFYKTNIKIQVISKRLRINFHITYKKAPFNYKFKDNDRFQIKSKNN